MKELLIQYNAIRQHTENICMPLAREDYVVQPVMDVSPPKWHLGHSTWFFETFVLKPHFTAYTEFDSQYNFVFNSYYETIGARVIRTDRGNLSRPSVDDIYSYRQHVNDAMRTLLAGPLTKELTGIITLGLHHEQQHQELLYTDIKYILGHNPLFPAYSTTSVYQEPVVVNTRFLTIPAGIYEIGHQGKDFCFDNEQGRHKVYLGEYKIADQLVTNGEYLAFVKAGAYQDFRYWHAEGWDWVKKNDISGPLYWHLVGGRRMCYTYAGLQELDLSAPVCHISYYEAAAYAAWKGLRLPTEAEWEIASQQFKWGARWEWTNSAYLPYPGFTKAPGAVGEYNGKFMVNQMVLRGASVMTPEGHSRHTYRNFFHPQHQWQFTGIRLAE
nr:ergothioneine biosynthesis protein EgtB [Chitinophaga pinensis]